jgi:hypothetical protein
VPKANAPKIRGFLDEAKVSPVPRANQRSERDRDQSLVRNYQRIIAIRKRGQ